MTKWEYMFLPGLSGKKDLDEVGGEGWELVSATAMGDYVLKRRISNAVCTCQKNPSKVQLDFKKDTQQLDLEDYLQGMREASKVVVDRLLAYDELAAQLAMTTISSRADEIEGIKK